jgi:phage terminase large subunit-like protein
VTAPARKPRGKAAGARPPRKPKAAPKRDVRRFKRRFDGFSQRAYEYAQAVVGGNIAACKEVRFACARFLKDLDAGVWTFRPELVDKVCGFIECLPHVKAEWAHIGPSGERQTIALQDWQAFILAAIFGFVGDDGTRRVRKAFIMLPRKNGKSVLAAAIGLFMLTMDDEPGAEVYCGATSEKQAWEVFRPAKRMAELVPDFQREFGLSVNAKSLTLPDLSFFHPTIGDPGDGPSPHCAIVDEYHEHASPGQLNSFVTGMGARAQPLLLVITTAGVNVAGPCFDEDRYARQVLAGMVEDDELFAIIYTTDEKDDWRDFAVWIKANPNYGVSIGEKYLRARHKEACERASKQNINRTKHLNHWVSSRDALLNILQWQRCAVEFGDDLLHEIVGMAATIGCDLAVVLDIAAIVLRVLLPDGREFYWPKFYLPEATVEDPENKNHTIYKQWVDSGFITATPGNTTDYEFILEDLKFWLALFEVTAIGFDPWQSNMLATALKNEGANVFEFGMSTRNLSAPCKDFEASVINGTMAHPGNPVFDWHATNVTVKEDGRGNVYPRKPEQGEHLKIDGFIAALIAKGLAMNETPSAPPTVTVLD